MIATSDDKEIRWRFSCEKSNEDRLLHGNGNAISNVWIINI